MKKLFKTVAVMAVAAALVVGAVFAAQNLTHESSATITYTLTSAYVEITGSYSTNGAQTTYSYDTSTTAPKANSDDLKWTINSTAIALTEAAPSITFTIEIVNKGSNSVSITIGDAAAGLVLPTNTTLTVGNDKITDSEGSTDNPVVVGSFVAQTLAGADDEVTLTFTLSLVSHFEAITGTNNFKLPIKIDAVTAS